MQASSFYQSVFKRRTGRILGIVVVMFFIFCLVSNVPSAQQKKKQLYDDLFSVSFPTENDGWACGRWGTVLHTSDGGNTWNHQNSGTDYTLSSIFFADPKNGWAVGDKGTIIHTRDGGKIWEKQKSPRPFFHMKVYFATPLKGWIATEQTHILSTEDGGKTWNIQFKDEDFILKSISFCDPLHGWAAGEYGYIYHTSDGGATWKKQAGHFEMSQEADEVTGGNFLFDVVAIGPKTAWAVGIDGYVIKTVDGGKTWKEVVTGAPKTQLFCVASDKKNTILIGGKSSFLQSTDNGQTWQIPKFESPITYGWIYGVAQQGRSKFVAVGWGGAIYVSSSDTWKRITY
jgi:photosystem II stability/assembly factor-like uncharacterized protein